MIFFPGNLGSPVAMANLRLLFVMLLMDSNVGNTYCRCQFIPLFSEPVVLWQWTHHVDWLACLSLEASCQPKWSPVTCSVFATRCRMQMLQSKKLTTLVRSQTGGWICYTPVRWWNASWLCDPSGFSGFQRRSESDPSSWCQVNSTQLRHKKCSA